jgi:pyruvate-formate lyase
LKRDIENAAITINGAQELVDCFWVNCNKGLHTIQTAEDKPFYHEPLGWADRIGFWGAFLGGKTTLDRAGSDGASVQQELQTVTLGGLTSEGLDGTNPLTYLCLNALYRLKMPQPVLYVRLHRGSPPELYKRVADCIRAGCAGPTIYNDEVFIPALRKLDIPIEHARDYTSDGCFEVHIQGRTHFKHGWISAAEALDRLLSPERWEEAVPLYIETMDPFRGVRPRDPYKFNSFDEVMESVKENLDKLVKGFI